jgi:hypothetical protein
LLISDEYRAMQKHLHDSTIYGVVGREFAPEVARIMAQVGAEELLDYGAGSRLSLKRGLDELGVKGYEYRPYEPAVPEYAGEPAPSSFVCCIDVLEHIEPELLDNVLDDLKRVTRGVGFYTIHSGPANKTLPDGRNAHLIQEGPQWWLPKIMERWELQSFQRRKNGFAVLVTEK